MPPLDPNSGPLPLAIAAVILLVVLMLARTAWKVLATLSFWSFFLGSLAPGLALLALASQNPGETGVTYLASGIHYLALGLVLGGVGGMFLPPSLLPPLRFPLAAIACVLAGMGLSAAHPGFKLPWFG